MFADWKNDVAHVKKSFGALGKNTLNVTSLRRIRCGGSRR